jgi:hypothetical protein
VSGLNVVLVGTQVLAGTEGKSTATRKFDNSVGLLIKRVLKLDTFYRLVHKFLESHTSP